MILAIIDCGTNTFNLLIERIEEDGSHTQLFNDRTAVKLGEESINKGFIVRRAFKRGLAALSAFRQVMDQFKVEKSLAIATSAIRDARNGKEFIDKTRELCGIEIRIIDGEREAEFIYSAIRRAVKMTSDISLIMDVGGGSTEFILANAQHIFWKGSFRIGAARLLAEFRPSDPLREKELKDMRQHLDQSLESLFEAAARFKPVELIGSSGAFESLIEMVHGELGGEPLQRELTEYHVGKEDYNRICLRILRSSVIERKKISSLVPMRRDMIVIFFVLVDLVISKFGFDRIRVSSHSLKEGVLSNFMEGKF
jgi:exopolyphosphatase/guanosine-5'-triphosphate,3'-diphosphate pyrophosphatase